MAQNPENVELARFYCYTQKKIERRLVLRQDPSVKRSLCKQCCSLLVPGVTCTTRQRKKRGKPSFTVTRCLSCGHSKKLLNNPDYVLWVDRPEAQWENQILTQPPETPNPPGSGKAQAKKKKNSQASQQCATVPASLSTAVAVGATPVQVDLHPSGLVKPGGLPVCSDLSGISDI